MKKANCNGTVILSEDELHNTKGGFLPVLMAAAGYYTMICALATIAGIATAFIVNRFE